MSYVSISGLVVEYIVAIDVTRVRFPADAFYLFCCDCDTTRTPLALPPQHIPATVSLSLVKRWEEMKWRIAEGAHDREVATA